MGRVAFEPGGRGLSARRFWRDGPATLIRIRYRGDGRLFVLSHRIGQLDKRIVSGRVLRTDP